jgi:CSLREA domain-containing protein
MKDYFGSTSRRYWIAALLTLTLLLGVSLVSMAMPLQDENIIEVNWPGDEKKSNDGHCTLREAIIAANQNSVSGIRLGECAAGSDMETDVILLPPGGYILERTDNGGENASQTGDLDLEGSAVIRRYGEGLVVISGNGISNRIFHVQPGANIIIEGVTIRDGNAKGDGGGIFNDGGTLNLINSTLTGNFATSSGALHNQNHGSNVATSYLTNVTITGNDAPPGAISGMVNSAGTLEVKNTIIAGDDCGSGVTFVGENLAYNAPGCSPASLNGDPLFETITVPTSDPALPDQNLLPSGTEVLFKLQSGSPAINQVGLTDCPDFPEGQSADQLGLKRPQGGLCDIGAVEREYTYLVVNNTSDDVTLEGSLPWAIQQANVLPGIDTILFSIGGDCADATIILNSPLPAITEPVSIDGTLNEDSLRCSALHITIDGNGNNFDGITIAYSAEGTTVRDLRFQNFGLNAILIQGDPAEPIDDGHGNTIAGNLIHNNGGSGIVIGAAASPSHGNIIEGNTIFNNGFSSENNNDGVTVYAGINNQFSNNLIYGNADLGIDLGADGRTDNDIGDLDPGANNFQNYPDIYAVSLQGYVGGFLDTQPGFYTLQFFRGPDCEENQPQDLIYETSIEVTVDANGNPVPAEFAVQVASSLAHGTGIRATATDYIGSTSELSDCVAAEENNVVWTQSKELLYGSENAVKQYLTTTGEERWYFLAIQPGMDVTIDLFNLPANYDLTVYKDIRKVYDELQGSSIDGQFDLDRAGAENPSEVISSSSFSPGAFTPGAFTPGAFTPGAFTPGAFTPGAFTPLAFTPGAFTEDVIAPGAFTPGAFTPGAFTPGAFTPGAFTPNNYLSEVDPELYASAQLSSLIAVSAFNNNASESVTINTFTNTGQYYIRVRGRNGVAVAAKTFSLQVTSSPTDCSGVDPSGITGGGPNAYHGNMIDPETVLLVDWTRLRSQYGDQSDPNGNDLYVLLDDALKSLADDYNGVVVEIGQPNSLIYNLNAEAEENDNEKCPYAKNLVAEEIKNVIDSYRFKPDGSPNPNLEYVVLTGSDDVAPFFRVPDQALLGAESMYQPPVSIFSSSEASLRNNFVLTDDFYGAKYGVSYKDSSIPAIDLAVGRLVESPRDMLAQINAFQALNSGVINREANGSSRDINTFVTGYDFLVDAVEDIINQLGEGTGVTPDTLVTPHDVAPINNPDPFVESGEVDSGGPWTGADLLDRLANNDSDLVFFAGHFSASSLLAADFETGITTWDILRLDDQGKDFKNMIIYSAGCHSGYNIVDRHSTPFTLNPDWASAIASVGGTMIGGTGYQYGDTQFLEYSERLYLYFTEALRTGNADSVSIGQAMVAAKQRYLAETPSMRGIHQKALIEATIFGLPMLSVDMPNRLTSPPSGSEIAELSPILQNPGAILGLQTAAVNFDFASHWSSSPNPLHIVDLDNAEGGSPASITASWYSGSNGVVSNPGEPAVPQFVKDVSSPVPGYSLRGVGFRGGTYADYHEIPGTGIPIYPVIGAATTEIRATNLSFLSSYLFPIRTWHANLYDALLNEGSTKLFATPVQYMIGPDVLLTGQVPPPSMMRRYNSMDFQLYFSGYDKDAGLNQPAQASSPDVAQLTFTPSPDGSAVDVEALVVANPGAGVQEVWVTFTGLSGPLHGTWQSLDLQQNLIDSRIWRGSFVVPPGTPMGDVRIIAQACGGNGRCTLRNNLGNFFTPGVETEAAFTEISQPQSNVPGNMQEVGEYVTFTADLTVSDTSEGIAGKAVFFGLAAESRVGITDSFGRASVTFLLVDAPAEYELTAWFPGDNNFVGSTSPGLPFTILQQGTTLTLSGPSGPIPADEPLSVLALLEDQSANTLPLTEQAILFAIFEEPISGCPVTDVEAETAVGVAYKTVYTSPTGEAPLGEVNLESGNYLICAYFRDNPSYSGSSAHFSLMINTPPVAAADSYKVNLGEILAVDAPGVLENDTDADGDMLTAELLSPPTSPGFLVSLAADGSFTYQLQGPVPAAFETTFTYRACDPYGACSEETTVTIEFNQCDAVTVWTEDGYPTLWPVDKRKTDLVLQDAFDPDSPPPLEVLFERIWMDEEPGKRADAAINQSCEGAWVLSDRDPQSNGRVYKIDFFLRDTDGAYCRGSLPIATLPHDQGGNSSAIIGPGPWVEVASCSTQLPQPSP